MFNIGFGELAIICIVLIIAVGPERLPSMMKTVGRTIRTVRQATRDLRESTGIDELMREDFDYRPPPRPVAPPPTPLAVSRDVDPTPAALASGTPPPPVAAVDETASLPSDAPVTNGAAAPALPDAEPPQLASLPSANVEGSLPSDAPLATPDPSPALEPTKLRES